MQRQLPIERRIDEVLATFPSEVRVGMLDLLMLEDSAERAQWIGQLYRSRHFGDLAELLIDIEADPPLRTFVVGMLRESDRS